MVSFTPAAEEQIANLANDKSGVDYVICTLGDKESVDLAESGAFMRLLCLFLLRLGTGGRLAVFKYLEENCEDKVCTGAFMVIAVDDRGNTKSLRRKYIHFIWVGPKTPLVRLQWYDELIYLVFS